MKYFKKLGSMVLALAMALSLAVPAMAAETVTNATTHTYQAYQIFKADSQKNDGGPLGNITWGTGIDSTKFLAALKADSRFDVGGANVFVSCESEQDVANALAENTSVAVAFADVAVEHITGEYTTIPATGTVELGLGYWLLVDTSAPGEGDAKNAALLQVVKNGDLTIAKKYDVPTVDKTVDDNDANIGDTVTFTLTATIPDRLDGYQTYKVVFHDTLSAGLDFVEGTIKVTVGGKDVTDAFTVSEDTGTLTISCNDVLAEGVGVVANGTIVVTYNAILDDDAVIGTEGNLNKVYLEYSNDPNW
ncbi:MAG: isopeptide-forming domain-containing fimbrial protein, partial [Ruminiclostridium sp.]|nr:isopeptide-forming domain-containing fimbrial protein [Ruminiclostridium sp.]